MPAYTLLAPVFLLRAARTLFVPLNPLRAASRHTLFAPLLRLRASLRPPDCQLRARGPQRL